MSKWPAASYSVDEATLVAEYHDEVDSILEAYARSSRACTRDRPHDAPTPGWDA